MTLERFLLPLLLAVILACATAHAAPEAPAGDAGAAEVAVEEPADAAATPTSEGADKPFGFSVSDGPLSINSEELEAADANGRRKIVFRKQVEVQQGELRVTCGKLEALYPQGSSQPSRLVASNNVHVTQGDQQVWCDQATYDRIGEKLLCRGNGRFLDGDSELRGREIDIDLKRETVRVRGGARVVIQDGGPASPTPAATP